MKEYRDIRISTLITLSIFIAFVMMSVLIVLIVRYNFRHDALHEAEDKARIILDRNLATHAYFSHQLKPSVFPLSERTMTKDYFDPTWMSSTFAVREIDKIFKTINPEDYYYKECAINARSPENEADPYERAFIERLNKDPDIEMVSEVRVIDGKPYFLVLKRGEVMEQSCLRCHDRPEMAPKGLVNIYGPDRSFGRTVNEVVSAVSIRVPLAYAYAEADRTSSQLSFILIAALILILAIIFILNRNLIFRPLDRIHQKAIRISSKEDALGEEISMPFGKELANLSESFNRMSRTLRNDRDNLEDLVKLRTSELLKTNEDLKKALEKVKTLSGFLPICAKCKKIRDDKGYWQQIEKYISEHSDVAFTHGLCPDCIREVYPELEKKDNNESKKDPD